MDSDLYFALRHITFAVAVVLHANRPIEIRSEDSLKGFSNFFINQLLPEVVDIKEAFTMSQFDNLEKSHWDIIIDFNESRKIIFPFRIHLEKIEDPALLDMMRFAYFIFYNNKTSIFDTFNLCSKDSVIINFVKDTLHNFRAYPNTCQDRSFLLDMDIEGFVASQIQEMERRTKKLCCHSVRNQKPCNPFSSVFKKEKKAPKSCTQTALQSLGLLNRRDQRKRNSILGFCV
jgi:hypothetical protein